MTRILIAAAATALLAGAAFAQSAPAPEHHMGAEHMRPRHHDPEKMAAHLRAALQLRADQEPALKAFVASMAPPKDGEAMHEPMRKEHEALADKPTPDVLDAMIAKAREHISRLEQHAAGLLGGSARPGRPLSHRRGVQVEGDRQAAVPRPEGRGAVPHVAREHHQQSRLRLYIMFGAELRPGLHPGLPELDPAGVRVIRLFRRQVDVEG